MTDARSLPLAMPSDGAVDTGVPRSWMTTRVDYVVNWARRNSCLLYTSDAADDRYKV